MPLIALIALLPLLSFTFAATAPQAALGRPGHQLSVSGAPGHEVIWAEDANGSVRLDPADGHVLDRAALPTTVGDYTVSLSGKAGTVAFPTGSLEIPRAHDWALARTGPGSDLLVAGNDVLVRVHPDGTMETLKAAGIQYVAGMPGGPAYAHGRDPATGRGEGLVIHGEGTACFLDGLNGPLVGPATAGDPLLVRERDQLVVVAEDCTVLAALPIAAEAATLTPDALWVRTSADLRRYARTGDAFGAPRVTPLGGPFSARSCGLDPCLAFGEVVWNPFTGALTPGVPDPERDRRPTQRYTLVGTPAGPYALRLTATGTRVVDTVQGHDLGVEIPRWARQGVVSGDGRLALVVDEGPNPRTALFEVATGRELWSLPALTNPVLLTARGAVFSQREPLLVDTKTGRVVLKLQSGELGGGGRGGGVDANLVAAPADWWQTKTDPAAPIVAATHGPGGAPGPTLAAWPAVEAPAPADAGPADDPLARALTARQMLRTATGDFAMISGPVEGLPLLAGEQEARAARVRALQAALGTTLPNPLEALRTTSTWPAAAGRAVDVPGEGKRRTLTPGRSVAGPTGMEVHGNPVSLPLRPDRPVLVVIGTDGELPERLLSTARDPEVDVLWALDEGSLDPLSRLLEQPGAGSVLPGLLGLTDEHDPAQTVEAGTFAGALAERLGLPEPGAMLVDAKGRVLAEGDIATMADAMRWRNLDGVRVPKPTPAEWRYAGPEPVRSLAALTDTGVAFRTDRTVGVLEADGRLRWAIPAFAVQIDVAGDRVLVSDGRRVTAYGAVDGAKGWAVDGTVSATGASWALVLDHDAPRIVAAGTGERVLDLRPLSVEGGAGDVLWFDGPEGWRCGTHPDGAPTACSAGVPVGGVTVDLADGALTATDASGREAWSIAAVAMRAQGETVLANLGSPAGPWVQVDRRGRSVALLLTDAPPDTNPEGHGPRMLYGTEDGAVVAWRAR